MWARPDEMNEVPAGFGGGFGGGIASFDDAPFASVALDDDDFDAPVYRSLGSILGAEAVGALDLAVEDESPRYRSCGGMPMTEQPLSEQDAEAAWLESMPPLIRRQQARRATFTIP